ncbi:hypothetical protein WJX72_001010 [[Myrmecia] bisecta]|uniref:AAA+ ATPase domain-containing protein n=1 Tax=[Myrmecia] bisecta TaxID=41462 RepID=A0AAW1PJ47_9CHLO
MDLDELLECEPDLYADDLQSSKRPKTVADIEDLDDEELLLLAQRQYVPPAHCASDIEGQVTYVTSEDGERVYCKVTLRADDKAQAVSRRPQPSTMLSTPIHALLQQVESQSLARALAESERCEQQRREAAVPAPPAANSLAAAPPATPAALWVDKYSPHRFMDLLSDEQINREVVKWVKLWDPCVFGRQPLSTVTATGQQQRGQPAGFAKAASKQATDQRPEQKLLLLCGAPGLGKTTLAHVIARHCGYRPVEINASDDRTADTLRTRIADAVQMQSVIGSKQPNLVILDEIDGAAGGAEGRNAISVLLKIVQATGGKRAGGNEIASHAAAGGSARGQGAAADGEDDEDNDGEGKENERSGPSDTQQAKQGNGRRGKKGMRPLCRPIIAVCNDLYTPALRPLRNVAKILQFKRPLNERLVTRLKAICAAEGLQADRQALQALCERTEGDVRSCLNTLQFLARRTRRVRLAHIQALQIGQKDMSKGAFTVWQELFQKRAKRGHSGVASTVDETNRLFTLLQDFGDNDLILAGQHENVANACYHDTHMQRTAAILHHFETADTFTRMCHRRGEFGLLKYVPACLLAVRSLAAGPERVMLQWPRASGEAHRRRTANQALLHSWMLDLSPAVYSFVNTNIAVQEVLPALMLVLAQPLRPVATHLFTGEERALMAGLVGVMIAYAFTFAFGSVAGEAEEATIQLTPAIHQFTAFMGLPTSQKPIPLAIRQMVVHEVQLETIRRKELAQFGEAGAPTAASGRPGSAAAASTDSKRGDEAGPSSQARQASARLQYSVAERAKAAGTGVKKVVIRKGTWLEQMAERQQQRKKPVRASQQGKGADEPEKPKIVYKFHEGFTNAVKRPVLFKDLL